MYLLGRNPDNGSILLVQLFNLEVEAAVVARLIQLGDCRKERSGYPGEWVQEAAVDADGGDVCGNDRGQELPFVG